MLQPLIHTGMKELERSVISNGEHAAKGKAVLDNIFHVMYKFCVYIFGDLKKKTSAITRATKISNTGSLNHV